MIKKAVAPERGSHCTLRADLCVFPRTWVHGVQFLLVPGRHAYALECPPRKQNKDAKLFCCHTEGLRSTPSLSLTYPKVPKHHILVIQALSLKYTLKNISLSICVIIFELCKSILP